MSPPITRKCFVVHGVVQGVGFRYWTARHAQRLRLRGIVRNRADGTVRIDVEGEAADVASLREAIRRGPRGARVDAVDEREPGDDELPAGFEIVRR